MPTSEHPPSLRERSRRAAEDEIVRTAVRLFCEQGYDETPTTQIAREAGVSERTLFRYFKTKQDLLGGNHERFAASMVAAIHAQPADTGTWELLRATIAAAVAVNDDTEDTLRRFRLLHATPSLRAGWLDKRLHYQDELLPLVAERAGTTVTTALRATVATAFACLDAAVVTWIETDGKPDLMHLYGECIAAVRCPDGPNPRPFSSAMTC